MKSIIEIKNISKEYFRAHAGTRRSLRDEIEYFIRRYFKQTKPSKLSEKKAAFWSLQNISLKIGRGEIIGVVGPNGAGKSTLLKILAGVTVPTSGSVTIRGSIGSLLEIGAGFHPDLTGRENIFLAGAVIGLKYKQIQKKFSEIVNFSGIEDFLDTPVKYYSSGMYIRLAFSIAVQMEPDILLIDEALAVGDTEFQEKSFVYLETLIKTGKKTIVIATHNMTLLRRLCSRALYLEKGNLRYDGSPQLAIENYLASVSNRQAQAEIVHTVYSPYLSLQKVYKITTKDNLLTVKLITEVKQPVQDVMFGISINTLDSIRIAEWRSPFFSFSRTGIYQFTCQLPSLFLRGGKYMLAIGARTKTGTNLDYIPKALMLSVPMHEIEKQPWNQDYGGFVIVPAQWTQIKRV